MSQHLIDSGRRGDAATGGDRVQLDGGEADDAVQGGGALESNGGSVPIAGTGAAAPSRADDPTVAALEALAHALDELADDQRLLTERLRWLLRERGEGRAWRDILDDEEPPGTMLIVSRMLACLAKASGTLRKDLVDALREEGTSIPAIAKLFGVTHQRVSNLLRRPSE